MRQFMKFNDRGSVIGMDARCNGKLAGNYGAQCIAAINDLQLVHQKASRLQSAIPSEPEEQKTCVARRFQERLVESAGHIARYSDTNGSRNQIAQETVELTDSR